MRLVKRFFHTFARKEDSSIVVTVDGRLLMEMHFGACGDTAVLSLPAVDTTVITHTFSSLILTQVLIRKG